MWFVSKTFVRLDVWPDLGGRPHCYLITMTSEQPATTLPLDVKHEDPAPKSEAPVAAEGAIDTSVKAVDEPQNTLTKLFTEQEWGDVKELRVCLLSSRIPWALTRSCIARRNYPKLQKPFTQTRQKP